MIRAIIFDCFGVLNVDGWSPFQSKIFGRDESLMQQAQSLNDQADSGLIKYNDFVAGVSKLANISFQEAFADMENNKAANVHLLGIIKQLKPNYKIGMLSNASDNWLKELFTSEQLSLFNSIALSYETGLVKPLPQAYYDIADRLGVDPKECVFIDDQERNCLAAKDCGMQAIAFKSNDQVVTELNRLLADTKS